jgi:hypothetical protein
VLQLQFVPVYAIEAVVVPTDCLRLLYAKHATCATGATGHLHRPHGCNPSSSSPWLHVPALMYLRRVCMLTQHM